MNRKIMGVAVAGAGLVAALALSAAPAAADPGPNNPKAQLRTFSCSDQNTYTGAFVGKAPANFLLVDSTNVFAIKQFTEFLPEGPKTFNTGINGFDPNSLITCSYTDPAGVFNIFTGFITPST
jgi:hypothetical protein